MRIRLANLLKNKQIYINSQVGYWKYCSKREYFAIFAIFVKKQACFASINAQQYELDYQYVARFENIHFESLK